MNYYIIIVAGGKGNRMQSSVPKQFIEINGKPILQHTLELFHRIKQEFKIIVVLPKAHITIWEDICIKNKITIPHEVCIGGEERFHSVRNGLLTIEGDGIVGIHDGVRPFVSEAVINNLLITAEKEGSAIPFIKVKESVRQIESSGSIVLDRSKIALIQTPQCFNLKKIKEAYSQKYTESFTDDASVYEAHGEKVFLCEGNPENIKITTPIDLEIAKVMLSQ